MLEKLKKIINRLFYIVAGMRLYTSLMPTNINRYRRYTTRIKIKSFEYDRSLFKSDQEKVDCPQFRYPKSSKLSEIINRKDEINN